MKKIFIISCLLLVAFSAKAQDIHFSQTGQIPLLINPASTGLYDGDYRAVLNYKNQWVAMGKPYRTFMGSYDMPIRFQKGRKKAYLGFGGYLYYDYAGSTNYTTTQFNVSVSGIVPLGEYQKISAGLQAGFLYNTLDLSNIQWPNQYNGQTYDPSLPSNEAGSVKSLFCADIAGGIQYHFLKYQRVFSVKEIISFTGGISVFKATRPVQRYFTVYRERLYPRIMLHSTLRYDFKNTGIGIIPSLLSMWQGPAREIDVGLLVRFRTQRGTNFTGFLKESAFLAGLEYRHKDAIIPQIFFEIYDFSVGFSYDINISSFSGATKNKGGLELSVKYAKMREAINNYRR